VASSNSPDCLRLHTSLCAVTFQTSSSLSTSCYTCPTRVAGFTTIRSRTSASQLPPTLQQRVDPPLGQALRRHRRQRLQPLRLSDPPAHRLLLALRLGLNRR
jgi:hypothetical protein